MVLQLYPGITNSKHVSFLLVFVWMSLANSYFEKAFPKPEVASSIFFFFFKISMVLACTFQEFRHKIQLFQTSRFLFQCLLSFLIILLKCGCLSHSSALGFRNEVQILDRNFPELKFLFKKKVDNKCRKMSTNWLSVYTVNLYKLICACDDNQRVVRMTYWYRCCKKMYIWQQYTLSIVHL